MKRVLILTVLFLILIVQAKAIIIYGYECNPDGSFELTIRADSDKKLYTKDIDLRTGTRAIEGEWDHRYISGEDYAVFAVGEGMFLDRMDYVIDVKYKLEGEENEQLQKFTASCPGLIFTCKKVGISIERCSTQDNLFRAYLNVEGLEQSKGAEMEAIDVLDFILTTKDYYTTEKGQHTKKGELPEDARLIKLEDKGKYLLKSEFKNPNHVEKLWAGFNNNGFLKRCDEKELPEIKFYDYKECDVLASEEEEEETEEVVEEEVVEEEEEEEVVEEIKEETVVVKEEKQEETKNLGTAAVSQEEPEEEKEDQKTKKYKKQLKTLIIILVSIGLVGGYVLYFLYQRGYM